MADYYSIPLVCFACRKSWKQRPRATQIEWQNIPCPQCAAPLYFVGRYFHAPSRNNLKQWRKVQLLYLNGWRIDGHQRPELSTLRAAKSHLAEEPTRKRAAQIACTLELQQEKWSKMRKWPRIHL